MSKETLKLKKDTVDIVPVVYHKLIKDGQYFQVESITVVNSEVIKTEWTEPTFLQIAFDQLRKKTILEHYQ